MQRSASSRVVPRWGLACAVWCLATLACGSEPMGAPPATAERVAVPTAGAAVGGNGPLLPPAGTPSAAAGSGAGSPLIVLPSAGSGGAPSQAPADCGTLTQMAAAKQRPADIVWIIDASASMVDELLAVQQNITAFASSISGAGVDHHVVMLAPIDVAAGTPLSMDAAHYRHVISPVDSHNALQLLLDQYGDYASFLRPDAALHFVVVTDDESFMPAADFRTQMEQRAGKPFIFHSIASEDANGLGCVGACGLPIVCGAFAPGRQYYALSDATGGEKISICVSDWSAVFGPLQKAVIESAPLPCEYTIPSPPSGSSLDPNKVNVELVAPMKPARTLPRAKSMPACGTEHAWFYDDPAAPKQIRMCPSACEALSSGGSLQIKLGCETVALN